MRSAIMAYQGMIYKQCDKQLNYLTRRGRMIRATKTEV